MKHSHVRKGNSNLVSILEFTLRIECERFERFDSGASSAAWHDQDMNGRLKTDEMHTIE